jgi:hypothetical protein
MSWRETPSNATIAGKWTMAVEIPQKRAKLTVRTIPIWAMMERH